MDGAPAIHALFFFGKGGSMEINREFGLVAFYHGSLTVNNTSGGVAIAAGGKFSTTNRAPASYSLLTLETAQIRYTLDGTTPTTSVGHLLDPGQALTLTHGDIQGFKAIRVGSTSGILMITSWCRPGV